jgi:hypothetical protein
MKAGRIRVVRATERIASHVRRRAALAPSDQLGGSKGVSSDPQQERPGGLGPRWVLNSIGVGLLEPLRDQHWSSVSKELGR